MAIILLEGFDHEAYKDYGATGNNMSQKGWSMSEFFGYVPGRFPWAAWSRGIEAAIINNGTTKVLPGTYSSLVCGFGIRITGSSGKFFDFGNCGVGIDSLRRLTILDGSNTVLATGTHQLNYNVWYYIEVKCDGSHATVHFNGFPEIGSTAGSFGSMSSVNWEWQNLGGVQVQIDDVYVLDTTTGTNTDFLGDTVVQTFFPVADGHYTDFTPKSGSAHYPMVDEVAFDGEATYVSDDTPSAKDSYSVGPALADTTIYAVQINLAARKQDSGTRGVKALIRQSATDYLSAEFPLSTDWAIFSALYDKDPTGATWLYTTVNADEYGIDIST